MSDLATTSRVAEFAAAVRSESAGAQIHISLGSAFHVDGQAPDIAVTPTTISQLQAVLSEANNLGLSVVPIGGGAHLGVGNVPASYDVALSLAEMNGIVAHEPADLTVTLEPGVRLTELQAALAEHGQFLPLDPPCGPSATIGGVLAANAYGPLRHAFGTARDWLIGIRVVHADGSISKSGGRVVKNVAGYDMHKLYAGSLGTLGVIAEATLKVAPLPHAASTLVISCRSAAHAAEVILGAHDAGLALQAAELLSPPASHAVHGESKWTALLRVAGSAGAVDRSIGEIEAACAATGAIVDRRDAHACWDAWSTTFRPDELSLRVSVMPSHVAEVMQVLDRRFMGAGGELSSTITAGVIRANLQPSRDARAGALVAAAQEVASRYEGSVAVDAAPPLLKQEIDVFGPLRSDFAIMKRLKEEFDPKRILSPGRFVGRI